MARERWSWLSLRRGRSSAVRDFAARDDPPGLPDDEWQADDGDRSGATARSGRWVLHTVQGSDGTWFVDGGSSCG